MGPRQLCLSITRQPEEMIQKRLLSNSNYSSRGLSIPVTAGRDSPHASYIVHSNEICTNSMIASLLRKNLLQTTDYNLPRMAPVFFLLL